MKTTQEMLAEFGLRCLVEHPDDFGDLEAGWLQDTAEDIGLLHRVHVTEPCGEHCYCVEYDDFPQDCLRAVPEVEALMKEVRA